MTKIRQILSFRRKKFILIVLVRIELCLHFNDGTYCFTLNSLSSCSSSHMGRASWPWSYGNWIYNYLCNQCLLLLMFWVQIPIRARCKTLCDKVCQWLATGQWFSPGTPVSSTNKTDRHNIAQILLKVALNAIIQTNNLLLVQAHVCQNCFYLIICAHDICHMSASPYDYVSLTIMTYPHLDICHMSASPYDYVSLTIMTYPHLDIFSWFFYVLFLFSFSLISIVALPHSVSNSFPP